MQFSITEKTKRTVTRPGMAGKKNFELAINRVVENGMDFGA
jgi:phage protein U